MKLGSHARRRSAAAAAIACVAIGVPAGALAASAPHTAAVARCTNANTDVWFADSGDGALSLIYYPVEFTNIGSKSCTMYGYPGVSAVNGKNKRLGPAATRSEATATPHTVTVKPHQTVSAELGIPPQGFVPCKEGTAAGFRVYPPNETGGQLVLNLSFSVCKNKSTLTIGPVTKGIGVP
jgi:hypothetical protein